MTTLTQNLEQPSSPTQVSIGALSKQLLETKKGVDGALKKMREQQEILKEKMGQIEGIAMMCEESKNKEIKDFAGLLRNTGDINILIKVTIPIDIFHTGTILMNSAYLGDVNIVKALLARSDILINRANDDGDTALTLAAEAGNIEIIELLLADSRVDIFEHDQASKAFRGAKNRETEEFIDSKVGRYFIPF